MQHGDAPTGGLESGDWRGETSAGTEGGSSGFHRVPETAGNGAKGSSPTEPARLVHSGVAAGRS